MIQKLVEIAKKEVGTRESGGNNCGTRIREYQTATEMAPGAWPWCAAFICYCIREWLKDGEVLPWLNLQTKTPEEWRPKTALAYGLKSWAVARPNTTAIFAENDRAEPGDIVTFDFSHVGLVVSDNGDTITTVEGNTNGHGERDSETGDGVWLKERKKSLIRNLIRIVPRLKKNA